MGSKKECPQRYFYLCYTIYRGRNKAVFLIFEKGVGIDEQGKEN